MGLGYGPCTLVVPIRSLKPCVLRLNVSDISQESTYLTKRFMVMAVPKKDVFYVQMPLAPKTALIELWADSTGDVAAERETSFDAGYTTRGMKKIGLRRHMAVVKMGDADVSNFVKFAQKFCYNCGVLPTGRDYYSDGKKFTVQYGAMLTEEDGTESSTPARIDKFTGLIEVSKRKFIGLTVPQRLCILLHEFSHLHLNEDEYNELEADLNGLTLYLGLGYPRFDALDTFITTFYNVTTDENMDRYRHIEYFVNNFDNYFNGKNI